MVGLLYLEYPVYVSNGLVWKCVSECGLTESEDRSQFPPGSSPGSSQYKEKLFRYTAGSICFKAGSHLALGWM
jgi:hypothetical protein